MRFNIKSFDVPTGTELHSPNYAWHIAYVLDRRKSKVFLNATKKCVRSICLDSFLLFALLKANRFRPGGMARFSIHRINGKYSKCFQIGEMLLEYLEKLTSDSNISNVENYPRDLAHKYFEIALSNDIISKTNDINVFLLQLKLVGEQCY